SADRVASKAASESSNATKSIAHRAPLNEATIVAAAAQLFAGIPKPCSRAAANNSFPAQMLALAVPTTNPAASADDRSDRSPAPTYLGSKQPLGLPQGFDPAPKNRSHSPHPGDLNRDAPLSIARRSPPDRPKPIAFPAT